MHETRERRAETSVDIFEMSHETTSLVCD